MCVGLHFSELFTFIVSEGRKRRLHEGIREEKKEKGKNTGNNKKEKLNVVAMVRCSKEIWCNDHCMFVYSFTAGLVKSICLVNHIYIVVTSLSLLHTELWILSSVRQ